MTLCTHVQKLLLYILQKGLLEGHTKLDCFRESKDNVLETWRVPSLNRVAYILSISFKYGIILQHPTLFSSKDNPCNCKMGEKMCESTVREG